MQQEGYPFSRLLQAPNPRATDLRLPAYVSTRPTDRFCTHLLPPQTDCFALSVQAAPHHKQARTFSSSTPIFPQIGGDALFVRPCASCPTRVSTVAFYMGDKSIGAFTTPTQKVAYTVTASGIAAGGVIWAQVRGGVCPSAVAAAGPLCLWCCYGCRRAAAPVCPLGVLCVTVSRVRT